MKTWCGYILFLYILFSAIVPCTIIDDCVRGEGTEQASGNGSAKKDCCACSPFSICSSNHGFTLHTVTTTWEPVVIRISPTYRNYNCSLASSDPESPFQPPRHG